VDRFDESEVVVAIVFGCESDVATLRPWGQGRYGGWSRYPHTLVLAKKVSKADLSDCFENLEPVSKFVVLKLIWSYVEILN